MFFPYILTKKMKITIFGNTCQAEKSQYVQQVIGRLSQHGATITIEPSFRAYLDKIGFPIASFEDDKELQGTDLAVSIGGDGTFLSTAAHVGCKNIPILGVNTGRLGFLADISPEYINQAIDALFRKDYAIESRSIIEATNNERPFSHHPYALNEVAVLKHDNSSLIDIRTEIDGELLTHYIADGLIVSTPTGSTGYSLSAGGPVIVPGTQTLCLSAVAPHSLYIRPVVLNDDVTITLTVQSRSHNFLVAIDGRSESFRSGTTITLRRAPYDIKVMKIHHKNFFDTLRTKMMWGADNRL